MKQEDKERRIIREAERDSGLKTEEKWGEGQREKNGANDRKGKNQTERGMREIQM